MHVNVYQQTLKMSAHAKKEAWAAKCIFTEFKGKTVCLVCDAQVTVFKNHHLKVIKHAKNTRTCLIETNCRTNKDFFKTKLHAPECSCQEKLFHIPQNYY